MLWNISSLLCDNKVMLSKISSCSNYTFSFLFLRFILFFILHSSFCTIMQSYFGLLFLWFNCYLLLLTLLVTCSSLKECQNCHHSSVRHFCWWNKVSPEICFSHFPFVLYCSRYLFFIEILFSCISFNPCTFLVCCYTNTIIWKEWWGATSNDFAQTQNFKEHSSKTHKKRQGCWSGTSS